MTRLPGGFSRPRARVAGLLLLACGLVQAAPGAHGPNGEHLDAPGASSSAGTVAPRLEAQTDLFELVARLGGGELSILIDRYATNEPVLDASVEVESGGLKATAAFRPDHGDYAIDDAALLKRLSVPGEHALVITVKAGADADLLDGTLVTGSSPTHDVSGPGDGASAAPRMVAAVLGAVGVAAAFMLFRRRRRQAPARAGGVQ
jgi:hypothetical protein